MYLKPTRGYEHQQEHICWQNACMIDMFAHLATVNVCSHLVIRADEQLDVYVTLVAHERRIAHDVVTGCRAEDWLRRRWEPNIWYILTVHRLDAICHNLQSCTKTVARNIRVDVIVASVSE